MEDLKLQIKQLDSSIKQYLQSDNLNAKKEVELISKKNEKYFNGKIITSFNL